MRIKQIHSKYYQKSLLFFYPLLGVKRGSSVTPVQTYLRWHGKYSYEDHMFLVEYYVREDREYKIFEATKLMGNERFVEMFPLENGHAVYVFNFGDDKVRDDYNKIVEGKYSKTSEKYKRVILDFYNNNKAHVNYIDSFLNPRHYFQNYAKLLTIPNSHGGSRYHEVLKLLKEVGELCSPPDSDQETFRMEPLAVNEKTLPLPEKSVIKSTK